MRPTTASIVIYSGTSAAAPGILSATGMARVAAVPLTRADIAGGAHQLLAEGYGLFLASNGPVLDQLDTAPFGVSVTTLDFLAPTRPPPDDWSVADLMRVYNVLNATSFGEKGIPLQNWVMIDLGLLPSAFLLVTLSARPGPCRDERGTRLRLGSRAHRRGAGRRAGRGRAAGLRRADSRRRLLRRADPDARRVGRLVAVLGDPRARHHHQGAGARGLPRTDPDRRGPVHRSGAARAPQVRPHARRLGGARPASGAAHARLPHRRPRG